MSDGTVVDVLYVKMIEKTIHRKLNPLELEKIRYGETIFVRDRRGTWMSFRVPLYRFPYDVMTKESDAAELLVLKMKSNIFEYAFNVGPISKVSLNGNV